MGLFLMDNRFTDYYRVGGIGGIKLGRENFKDVPEIPWDIQRSLVVNPNKKLIYYKPGKCAGTSIFRHILQPMGGWVVQKDNPKEFSNWIQNITDEEMNEYFTFIFVRNPFSRLISFWYDTFRESHPNFKEYVMAEGNIFNNGVPKYLHLQTQSSLVELPDSSKSNLNFIGKVENIDSDWKDLCSKIDIPYVPMVHIKKRNHKHYTEYYDEETISLVSKMYNRDLQVFNYTFGD
tara:strand:- start:326 stop:1027 length:702 start_codon:yes stop_codon:yes gene_type:complete